jgi:hypothetical protein
MSRECYPPWKPNMATHVALETFASSGAIADRRSSGHSNVGHHDIIAVPFGVSLSRCFTFEQRAGWVVGYFDKADPRNRHSKLREIEITSALCPDRLARRQHQQIVLKRERDVALVTTLEW